MNGSLERVHAFCDDALGKADATEVARRIRQREISVKEAVSAAIERAERLNPRLNAIVTPLFDRALELASEAPSGVFGGVPSFLKDNQDFRGAPTFHGTRAVRPDPAAMDSPFVEQFLSMGPIILGKTTLPEVGLASTTESLLSGATRNPWSLAHSSGGSSGGASALVAAGVVPFAHGNDGGGSLRGPASCCGLVGLKASRGRLPKDAIWLPVEITSQGVLTRSVRDTATFLYAAECHTGTSPLPQVGKVERPTKKQLRIAFFTDLPNKQSSDSECARVTTEAARLCEDLGHRVEWISCPYSQEVFDDYEQYFCSLAFATRVFGRLAMGASFDPKRLEPYTLGLAKQFRRNAWRCPMVLRRLRRYPEQYRRTFETYDILVSPTNGTPPPEIGFMGPDQSPDTLLSRLRQHCPFTAFQNISGAPAISLPLGHSRNGLPIGVQFAANIGEDRLLLELALQIEEAKPPSSLEEAVLQSVPTAGVTSLADTDRVAETQRSPSPHEGKGRSQRRHGPPRTSRP
jgi:amidase